MMMMMTMMSQDWFFAQRTANNNRTAENANGQHHHHVLRIFENRPAGSYLADFSHQAFNFQRFCPDVKLTYTIDSVGQSDSRTDPWVRFVETDSKGGVNGPLTLTTTGPLDRETTPNVTFQVTCAVQPTSSSSSPTSPIFVTQNFTLRVEDEDDNAPRLQTPPPDSQLPDVIHHEIYLEDEGIIEVLYVIRHERTQRPLMIISHNLIICPAIKRNEQLVPFFSIPLHLLMTHSTSSSSTMKGEGHPASAFPHGAGQRHE